jgi:DNA-binding MarR family transcriptional regulator
MLWKMTMRRDAFDEILAQWREERPELDSSGMSVVLRVLNFSGILSERLKGILEPAGLLPFEYDVLSALRRSEVSGGMTPTELCRSAQLTSGAMTHRLDRLEERGLVRRKADKQDRRSVQVSLTVRGKKIVDSILGARMADATKSLGGLTKQERRELARLLRLVGRDLESLPRE